MARGTVVGEKIVSQASSDEFRENFEKTFDDKETIREVRRGRYVHRPGHPKANKWGNVHVDDLGDDVEPDRGYVGQATDLWMDGVAATDGVDIGSRKKRQEYMAARGLVDADDFKGDWEKAAKERERIMSGEEGRAERREIIGRELYKKGLIR